MNGRRSRSSRFPERPAATHAAGSSISITPTAVTSRASGPCTRPAASSTSTWSTWTVRFDGICERRPNCTFSVLVRDNGEGRRDGDDDDDEDHDGEVDDDNG